jgi:hypothetical protein
MAGSGGMGALSSSRLTRVLQEKAELLKKRRQAAEQVLRDAEDRSKLLAGLGISVPGSADRLVRIHELARRSDWDAVETQARELLGLLDTTSRPEFEARRQAVLDRGQQLLASGARYPDDLKAAFQNIATPITNQSWSGAIQDLARVDEALRRAEGEFIDQITQRALLFADWAGSPAEHRTEIEGRIKATVAPFSRGPFEPAREAIDALLIADFPAASERRRVARDTARPLVDTAKELGVPTATVEERLAKEQEAGPLEWPLTLPDLERASTEITVALRYHVASAVQSMRATVASLPDLGTDVKESIVRLEELAGQIPEAGPVELPKVLAGARKIAEAPVVAIVAGLLDEVRPRLADARRLGRDPSEVFASMNRAREALRLNVYSEALAAAQEAVDRVAELTADLDSARGELESLEELLGRLANGKIPLETFRSSVDRARQHLDAMEVEPAHHLLQESLEQVGVQAYGYYTQELERMEGAVRMSSEAGFLPPELDGSVAELRGLLEGGELTGVGEGLARLDVQLLTAARPFVSHRLEELEKGFEEIQDEATLAPVRRALADADVSLRVKADLTSSLESLKKAEREFDAIFAAHASALVETLEDERKTLDAMGGAGDEIQRQIDEVQQIFNMGDFVKASRASQEIRQRAQQQQLVRSEEAISHAKLALVEVGSMGLETGALRSTLESAQQAAQELRLQEAFQLATETERRSQQVATEAHLVVAALGEAMDKWQALKRLGVDVEGDRQRITVAQQAYHSLSFAEARAILSEVVEHLRNEEAFREANRYVQEITDLLDDGHRLSVPLETVEARLEELKAQISATDAAGPRDGLAALEADLLGRLRPTVEENLKNLEQDLDVARAVSSDIGPVLELIADARRKASLPLPIGIAQAIETAHSNLIESRGFREHAEKTMRRAQEALNQAELVHVAAAAPRKEMERIEERFQHREYARVIERAGTLERELNQLSYQHVSKTLSAFQAMLGRSREEGKDTTTADDLLKQSRRALEEGRPLEALQLATRSESELERVDLQMRLAKAAMDTLETKYSRTTAEGIRAPIAGAEISKARIALDERNFVGVLEFVFSASDSLAYSRDSYRRSRDFLDAAEKQLEEAVRFGADLDPVAPVIEAARQHISQGEYTEAIREAREATDLGRQAIERQSAGALEELRTFLETARSAGIRADSLAPITDALQSAEISLKAREWARATESLRQGRTSILRRLDEFVQMRKAELEIVYAEDGTPMDAEKELRAEVALRILSEAERRNYLSALQAIDEERRRVHDRRKGDLVAMITDFRNRMWVAERLRMDATPVMQLFSEAKAALDSDDLAPVPDLLRRAEQTLVELVRPRIQDKIREVRTELGFAQDGLHVIVGGVAEKVQAAEELNAAGEVVAAAQAILEADDNLTQRKAKHRELQNIHYLIDASLTKAAERHLVTDDARRLLEESIQLRQTDYSAALERARQALVLLQGQLKTPESSSGLWPFRRPPNEE